MARRTVGIFGLALHVLVGVVPFAVTTLVAPAWAAIILGLWWVALAGVAVRTFRHRPLLTPIVPLIAVALWFGVIGIGDLLLSWNA